MPVLILPGMQTLQKLISLPGIANSEKAHLPPFAVLTNFFEVL